MCSILHSGHLIAARLPYWEFVVVVTKCYHVQSWTFHAQKKYVLLYTYGDFLWSLNIPFIIYIDFVFFVTINRLFDWYYGWFNSLCMQWVIRITILGLLLQEAQTIITVISDNYCQNNTWILQVMLLWLLWKKKGMSSFFACQVLRSVSVKEYITSHPTLQVEKKTGNMKTE